MSEYSGAKSSFFGESSRAVGIAIIFTLASVLIFAFFIKIFSIDTAVIKPVNQFLKVISIFTGCFFTFKNSNGLLKGLFTGTCITVLTYLIFALISGSFAFDITLLIEVVFGALIGALSGIITVNLKK